MLTKFFPFSIPRGICLPSWGCFIFPEWSYRPCWRNLKIVSGSITIQQSHVMGRTWRRGWGFNFKYARLCKRYVGIHEGLLGRVRFSILFLISCMALYIGKKLWFENREGWGESDVLGTLRHFGKTNKLVWIWLWFVPLIPINSFLLDGSCDTPG